MKEIKVSKNGKAVTEEHVSIIAIQKTYKNRPYYATPIFDSGSNTILLGKVHLDEQLMKAAGINIVVNNNYIVQNNDKLKLLKDKDGAYIVNRDFILYNLYLIQPVIAESLSEVRKGTHFFYLNNAEVVADEENTKKRLIGKAYALLTEASMKDQSDMLYYFNLNPLDYSAAVVENKAFAKADEFPEKVIDFFVKRDVADRYVFVNKLLKHKLLFKDKNGYIMYDRTSIGFGEDAAVSFLYDEKNEKIFTALRGTLDAIEGHKN